MKYVNKGLPKADLQIASETFAQDLLSLRAGSVA